MAKVGVGETFAEMVLAICVLSSDLGGTPRISSGLPFFSLTPTTSKPPNVLAKAAVCLTISSDHCSLKSRVQPSDGRSVKGSDSKRASIA